MRIRETQNIRILRIRMRIRNTGTFTSFFKDQKSKRTYKTVEIKVFVIFLLDDGQIRMRIREAQKQTDPTDPQH
jgi:hypothetical protein